MKITLEASAILHPLTGIGRYTWELATRFSCHPMLEELNLYVRNEIVHDPHKITRMSHQMKTYPLWSKPLRLISRTLKKRHAVHACQSTLVHGPNYFLPPCAQSGIITVHDLSIYRYPETHPLERIKQFEKNFKDTLRRTEHIIADSVSTQREIVEVLGWPENKISVVALGVAPEFKPLMQQNNSFLDKYGLQKEGYALCVSTIEPRKNIDTLVQAYEGLPVELRKAFPLVLIGGEGWLCEPIVARIKRGVSQGWIIRPGYVSEVELVLFYQNARVFVYPSEYEGFGLPVAEAMACGIPVVISNRTSLPEVAQGCGMMIEPHDTVSFSQAIRQSLCDEQWRNRASIQGVAIASGYTWDKCVADTISVYSKVYDRG